jgi:hypothetical protein
MRKPFKITYDMLRAAQAKGWTATLAGKNYGCHPTTISAACERYGVELQKGLKFAAPSAPVGDKEPESDARVKAFSASPDAIRRALARKDTHK